MNTPLKTITEHNAEVLANQKKSKQTNIACPWCGRAMVFSDEITLASSPPKRRVYCADSICEYKTYVY